MGKRRRSRELALKVLFHFEFSKKDDPAVAFDLICNNFGVSEDIKVFSKELVLGVCVHIKELDNLISKASQNWRLERIAIIDRSILRLAVFELLYRDDIPPKVSINEAVDVGKKFGTEESGAFINGILDKIYNTLTQTSQNSGPGEIK
ncbi:MAG: transcription antitermination factor NusB [Deltaproteobacteria bacterium]|nr:MAG: transcription antitermination factor NusB [Deltaproteobacteria bacterium]